MAQVCGNSLVIIFGCYFLPGVPVVAGGIVDEDRRRANRGLEGGKSQLQGIDITQVARLEMDYGALSFQRAGERRAALHIDIDEADS